MLSLVLRTIREHHLIEAGDGVLIAVSGGPDSMALLAALWELRARLGVTLEVAAVDHGLRAEARLDLQLVSERARDLGLPFHPLAVDVRAARAARAAGGSSSWQEIARRLRLAALTALAGRLGLRRIALGHQADDQAETILFRILRGTGVRGLRGIPHRRGPFIRPLLEVRRRQVLEYLRRRSIPFVEDPSNADLRFTRARLRHRILPLLGAENPRLVEALRALAADAARLIPAADEGSTPVDPEAPPRSPSPTPPPGWRVSRRVASAIERRRAGGGTTRMDVAGGEVEISYGEVTFHARPSGTGVPRGRGGGAARAGVDAGSPIIIVSGPGDYRCRPDAPGLGIRQGDPLEPLAGEAIFDADVVAPPLQLRALRPGDRMNPRGGRGSRKLSDLLIDAKIARHQRAGLPVLTTADGVVLFVPGLRPAELGRPTAATRRWLSVRAAPPLAAIEKTSV